jgi:TonB family protein
MNKTTLTFLIFVFATICMGQTTETKYYTSESLEKEVSREKAKFSQTIIKNEDGSVTTQISDLKKDHIVSSETFVGNEPYGIWKVRYGKSFTTLDYNFPLIYSNEKCADNSTVYNGDIFQDNDSLKYKAPKIASGEQHIFQFVARELVYPMSAIEENIQGKVYLQFDVSKEGNVENIVVFKGANMLIDKEAVRVLRQLKFSSPPKINGQSFSFKCLMLPINFELM